METRLAFKFRTRTSLQTVLTSTLLRMSQEELEQAILREFRDNPRLASGLRSNHNHPFPDDRVESIACQETATDYLVSQIRLMIAEDDLDIAIYLVQSLDSHGYLPLAAGQVAADMDISPHRAMRLINTLRELEPAGIGARDTRDCLLMQCADLENRETGCDEVRNDLCRMITLSWDDVMHQRWQTVARATGLSAQRIEAAMQFMRTNLYPYPLSLIQANADNPVRANRADICIRTTTDAPNTTYTVDIPAEHIYGFLTNPDVPLNERGRSFLFALRRRWATLRRIGEALIAHQTEFLCRGRRFLQPVTRVQLANELGMHESTFSRAIADKSVQLPTGQTIPLAELFDPSCAAKTALREIVQGAPKPLSDEAIARELRARGFDLTRRTVTKYRSELGLPPRNRRKTG